MLDEIVNIEKLEDGWMLDIEVDRDHLFYANDILTKNSMGTGATADFMAIFGDEADMRTYENEIHYKILKNRLGGRVGEINKFYYDANSLTIYDVSELDSWRSASLVSGDQRKIHDKKISMPRTLGKKSRKRSDDE
jgi:hypothetical protein